MYYANGFGHMMGFGYGAEWMLVWGFVVMILVGIVVWTVARKPHGSQERGPTPEETLKQRYARGEVDHEEYRTRLQELRR